MPIPEGSDLRVAFQETNFQNRYERVGVTSREGETVKSVLEIQDCLSSFFLSLSPNTTPA